MITISVTTSSYGRKLNNPEVILNAAASRALRHRAHDDVSERAQRVSHASGAGIVGAPASERVGEFEGR